MNIVAISDTHGMHDRVKLPKGDVLIHAGDFCNSGSLADLERFVEWLGKQPFERKLVVAGNHDKILEKQPEYSQLFEKIGADYLFDSAIVIDGIKFYGSPFQPAFCDWAFNLPRGGEELKNVWAKIPDDTDVLITHSPPHGILDRNSIGEHCGCEHLRDRVWEVKPKYHVFGHLHESSGMNYHSLEGTTFVNICICDGRYNPRHKPFEWGYEE